MSTCAAGVRAADRTGPGPAASDPSRPRHGVWQRESLRRHVVARHANGPSEVMLLIDGLRCSSCVLTVERALTALPGVHRVHINTASHRARVVWDEHQTALVALLEAVSHAGYQPRPLDARALDDSRRDESRDLLKRLLVAGFGAMQAMMFASALYVGAINPMHDATRELFRWLGFLIATPVVMYAARPFFAGALRALRSRRLGMDVPVALAVTLVYGASLAAALSGRGEVYFDSVSMFVFFLLTGRYLEMRGRHRALDLSDALARLTPEIAWRRATSGALEEVPVIELVPGDRIHVDSGAVIPADGRLERGACRVDESLLTGESVPRRRAAGEPLLAGSMVIEGPVDIEVRHTGADTTLAGVASLVGRAQAERPRLARAGDRIVGYFVLMVLSLAALTALAWAIIDSSQVFTAVVAVLVVSCPCAFALAVPAAFTRTLAVLARDGVLVACPDAIETLATATHVVFDKTGTLTDGLRLGDIRVAARHDGGVATPDQVLYLAAALARESRHPVSRAIVAAAGDARLPRASEVENHAGLGLSGSVDGRALRLGRPGFALPEAADRVAAGIDGVVLADHHGLIAVFQLSERLRRGAREAVAALRNDGVTMEIASGDAAPRVARIARELGIEQWRGAMLPADKLARLRALRAGGRVIAVGDGINDAPVLAGADAAIAIAEGTDLARAASDIVLTGERLELIARSRQLARQTLAVMRQNQRWALAYNLVAIPLAAGGLVPPWLAAIGMSASSLGVVMNALRIGRDQRAPRPTGGTPQAAPA